MFFTIITCTYNRADTICRALDSLLQQSCDDWECIIADDASTDHTKEIIQPYLSERVLYRPHSHRGCALSKNAGMAAARGEYITFLDSDDTYLPEHLKIRKDILQTQPEIDLLHSNVKIIGNAFVPNRDHPETLIHINDCVIGGTFCIKRESLSAAGQFQDTFSDDHLFLTQFQKEGKNILKIDAPTYVYYRESADSLCNNL